MANIPPIQFKRSSKPRAKPTTAQMAVGEIALNLADRKIYTKDSDGLIIGLSDTNEVEVFDSEKALLAAATLNPNTLRRKGILALLHNKKNLVTWDSDKNSYIEIAPLNVYARLDSEYRARREEDSDLRKLIDRGGFTTIDAFVSETDPEPTNPGYYIFRSSRKDIPALKAAATAYNGSMDSDDVMGSLYYRSPGGWAFIKHYDSLTPTISIASTNYSYAKNGLQRWGEFTQYNQNYTYSVPSISDLTSTLKNNSSGFVWVEGEQEMYTWSQQNDQTVNNGWTPIYPVYASTAAKIATVRNGGGVYLDNRRSVVSTESIGYYSAAEKLAAPGMITARAPTNATVTLVGNATNTHVTRTPDSDNEIRLASATTNQQGTAHFAFSNTNFKWHKGFEVTWSQYIGGGNSADAMWVCLGGSSTWAANQTDARSSWYNSAMNGYLIYMDVYDNNNFVRHARLYGPGGEQLVARSNTISDLRAGAWVYLQNYIHPIH